MEKSKFQLKHIAYRKLKSGDYILYAAGSELAVVNQKIALKIIEKKPIDWQRNSDIYNFLKDSKFILYNQDEIEVLPCEPKSHIFKTMQIILTCLFLVSVVQIILLGGQNIVWNSLNLPILINKESFFIGVLFSITTTVCHELMHIIFSNNIKHIRKVVGVSIKKSVAYVSLTHVWTWSIFSRLIAVAAGVMLDTIVLAILLKIIPLSNNELFTLLIIIIQLRIVWQFRFHRNTDGKYFMMMLLDNPLIAIDYKNNKDLLTKKECQIWKFMTIVGRLVDLYLLFFWIIPILYRIIIWIGGIL